MSFGICAQITQCNLWLNHLVFERRAPSGRLKFELKSVETIAPVHYKQLLTYLKLTTQKLGLLINFNEALIKNGIKRVVNGL
jgi:PD-(D/E)XK nuclease superfamily